MSTKILCSPSRSAITPDAAEQRLKQIDQAETFLRKLVPVEFRVRHHDAIARIEVHPKDVEKIATEPFRSQIVEKLKSLGFKFVTLDLQGFRSGSLNELLTAKEKTSDCGGGAERKV